MPTARSIKKLQFLPETNVSFAQIGAIALVGLLVGVTTWLLSLLLQSVVIQPLFCRSVDSFSVCNNGGNISFSIAAVIAHIGGLFALIKVGTYRPLLVILSTIVTLWGVQVWLGALSWYEATLLYSAIVAISYALFAWLSRIVNFGLSLGCILLVIIIARFYLGSL